MGRAAFSPKPHSETVAGEENEAVNDEWIRDIVYIHPCTASQIIKAKHKVFEHHIAYSFVHLQLYAGLEAEKLVRSWGGEGFGAVCEEEEIIEEESPQLSAAFGFVKPTAVEQLAGPEAVSQRVEDQVLKERRAESKAWLRSAMQERKETVRLVL